MNKTPQTFIAVFLLSTIASVSNLLAETAAERWGRAQTDYNSYEANRQSRERNKPGYPSMSAPQKTFAPTYDSTPRSGSEVAAEHEAKMQAMHQKWADIEAARKRRQEMEEAKAQAALLTQWKKNEEMADKKHAAAVKKYAALNEKAAAVALQSDKKWDSFLNGLTPEDQQILRLGYKNELYWHSPMADIAQQYLSGKRKPKKGTAVDAARKILERGISNWDFWCVYDLGNLEVSQDPQNGEAKRTALYESNRDRYRAQWEADLKARRKDLELPWMAYRHISMDLVRAYAFGWGVPVNPEKADSFFSQFKHQYDTDYKYTYTSMINDPTSRHVWVDAHILRAEMMNLGMVGYPADAVSAQNSLKTAFKLVSEHSTLFTLRDKAAMLMTLLGFGGDLDDKTYSASLLKEALDAGYVYVGGEYVYKLLKGEGTSANPEAAYKTAIDLPGMQPKTLSRVVRLWLGNDGVNRDTAKAKDLLARFAEPNNPEHVQLMEEANKTL